MHIFLAGIDRLMNHATRHDEGVVGPEVLNLAGEGDLPATRQNHKDLFAVVTMHRSAGTWGDGLHPDFQGFKTMGRARDGLMDQARQGEGLDRGVIDNGDLMVSY